MLLLLTAPVVVQAQFIYTTNADGLTLTITGYAGLGGAVMIPDTINNYPVTGIGDSAFENCASLTSVTIGDGVTSIGHLSFLGCTNLINVTLGNGITSLGGYGIGGGPFAFCTSLPNITIPNSVSNIGFFTFAYCSSLTNVSFPDSLTSIQEGAFMNCARLASATLPNRLPSIGQRVFTECGSLTNVTIPNSVTNIAAGAFQACTNLTSITIPGSVTSIGDYVFYGCPNLAAVHFNGNAPSLGGSSLFSGALHAIIYYLPGTTGWGATFGGRPTALWDPPAIQASPQTQTAEANSAIDLRVRASGSSPRFYFWYFSGINLIRCSTNCDLELTNLQFSQSGAYTAIITNIAGAVTSSPAMLNVIAPVDRRPMPRVKVTGEAGSIVNLASADALNPTPTWTQVGSVSLTSTSQDWFDVTQPLPPQRFYRAWQTGAPGTRPSLDLHPVPAITLTGAIGRSVRLDYINQFGPTDAWVTLATVKLTNTSQLYFDISALDQSSRLYRLVPLP